MSDVYFAVNFSTLLKKFTDSDFTQWFGDVMKTIILSGKKPLLKNAQISHFFQTTLYIPKVISNL